MDHVRSQLARRRTFAALALGAALVSTACSDGHAGQAEALKGEGGAPYSLDSALTVFRAGLEPIAELEGAQPSIDSTLKRFSRMVQESDTATLRAMVMTRREYAYLYYPSSAFTRAPTKQEPGLNWFLHVQNSQKGASRLFNRYGGQPLRIVSNVCKEPRLEGENRLWYDCIQRIVAGTDTVSTRLFGGIIERNGRFKLFSYSNDL